MIWLSLYHMSKRPSQQLLPQSSFLIKRIPSPEKDMRASHCSVWARFWILTIDQDLRPPADFGEANLGWDPLIIGDVHHCRRISMRGQLLMTRGLLFKSKDHVIQPLGGISSSLCVLDSHKYSSISLPAHPAWFTNRSGALEAFLWRCFFTDQTSELSRRSY